MDSAGPAAPDDQWNSVIERVADGDQSALGELYDRFAKPLYSIAYKLLSNPKEAEEVVQDVFVVAWKKAATFEPGRAQLFTWLTVITRNKCLDRLRAKSRRIPTSDLFSSEAQERDIVEQDVRTGADALADRERSSILRGAIAQLPGEQKEVIDLAFFSGMTHSEIAEKLEISIGTIKSRIRYGVQKLRTMLGSDICPSS